MTHPLWVLSAWMFFVGVVIASSFMTRRRHDTQPKAFQKLTYVLAWIGMWCERWARFRLALLLASYRPKLMWCEHERRLTEHRHWWRYGSEWWFCTGSHQLVTNDWHAYNPRRFLL